MSDDALRKSFDEEALLYNKIRPRYPGALFSALMEITHLPLHAQLLEIGPGTGQATEPLAKRGYNIVAVELGANLAAVARESLKNYPNVQVITGAFEDAEFSTESFDLVYSATAFHWIRPEVRFAKPYDLLKPGGHLAVIHTNHVSDEKGDEFFYATQPMYEKYTSNYDPNLRLPLTRDLRPPQIDETLFVPVFFEAFPLIISYNSKEYA